jgi:hypothetical protein
MDGRCRDSFYHMIGKSFFGCYAKQPVLETELPVEIALFKGVLMLLQSLWQGSCYDDFAIGAGCMQKLTR